MANVLGELFSDIADAIRTKTGEAGTMKPNEFPERILSIVGGGSGDAALTYKSGSFFSAESGINTIEHSMGCVPDMIVVYVQQIPQNSWLVISVGYSQAMINSFSDGAIAPTSFIASDTNVVIEITHGMETTSELAEKSGAVRNVNASTFTVGGNVQFGLMPEGSRWNWFAISGIFSGSGGSGGSGCSLPAGLYWKSLGIQCQNKYYQQWFEYNGELYAITNQTSGSAAIKYVYKWSGTSWTQVVNLSTGLTFANASGATLVEYNGVIHLSGGESNAHYVFNGTTLTAKSNLPNKINSMGMFVQNGLLKAYSYYDGIVYVWDEASDTWTAEATIGSKYNYYNFFTIGGVVYAIYSNKVYIYADGAATQCGTTTSFSTPAVVYDGCLYYKDSYNMQLYRYDPATSAAAVVGTMPVSGTNSPLFVYNGELCYLPYSASEYFSGTAMYEVTDA